MIILELAKDLNIIEEYESVDNGALYKREKQVEFRLVIDKQEAEKRGADNKEDYNNFEFLY